MGDPSTRGDVSKQRPLGDRRAGDRAKEAAKKPPAPLSKDEKILRDLEMLMLFEMLRDFDLFAEDEG